MSCWKSSFLSFFFNKMTCVVKGNDYYSNKICSQGDTSTVIYFSKFGEGRGPTAFYFLKEKITGKA